MDGELSLKFTLTETIINTGWLLKNAFAWVSSTPNSDMHDALIWGNTMHFSLYRWTLYLTTV
jgi:hypothetical protein